MPIVAISGESGSDLQTQIDSCGFTDFYAKPVKKNHVEEIVKQFCGLALKSGAQLTGDCSKMICDST